MKQYLHFIIVPAIILASCSSTADKEKDKVAEEAESATETPDKIAEVTVMELQPTLFNHEIVSNGQVTAREKVDVSFQTSGIISAIYVRNGQRVTKGQPIAMLDTYKLDNQLEKDRNAVASATLEMQDVLIGQGYDPSHIDKVPAEVMDLARLRSGLRQAELQLAATKREIQEATLVAPVSGVVANLTTKPHNTASPSQPLCRIINDSGMDVEFPVLESELPMVRQGDAVAITPFSSSDSRTGKVSEINPMVDENGM
ncbi:MAG: efflux RND transporter periplasmic adaptor subunit, partial [Duncaniella sp.]|nr:efflux RND transporter periplasmic adaptor subunit [Duncaniella sp.]